VHESSAERFLTGPGLRTSAIQVHAVGVGEKECGGAGELEGGIGA
jgi:hypothetical protein